MNWGLEIKRGNVLADEQKRYRKGSRGQKDQLKNIIREFSNGMDRVQKRA